MKLAVVQTNPTFGEVRSNIHQAIDLMEAAQADLYVLPELFTTGYNFADLREVEQLAEPVQGNTFKELADFAKRQSCYLCYGFAEVDRGKYYNSAALIGPEGLIGHYRKVHLFFRENLFFAPGNFGFPVYDLPWGKVGMMVCFDWYYPESARSLALQGAQVILHPSNLVLPHCPDAMVTRCLENRVFAATANRIGRENRSGVDLTYIGKSELVTPRGKIMQRLASNETGVGVQEVDLSESMNKQLNEFNNLFDDRRTDQYKV